MGAVDETDAARRVQPPVKLFEKIVFERRYYWKTALASCRSEQFEDLRAFFDLIVPVVVFTKDVQFHVFMRLMPL